MRILHYLRTCLGRFLKGAAIVNGRDYCIYLRSEIIHWSFVLMPTNRNNTTTFSTLYSLSGYASHMFVSNILFLTLGIRIYWNGHPWFHCISIVQGIPNFRKRKIKICIFFITIHFKLDSFYSKLKTLDSLIMRAQVFHAIQLCYLAPCACGVVGVIPRPPLPPSDVVMLIVLSWVIDFF